MKNTVFIAVQCFQCSTMQVKQQKRSSNKWACAVCNERQSVRRVHARSYLAKDVRLFVQSFNMARMPSYGSDQSRSLPRSYGSGLGSEGESQVEGDRRRRTDWSEYLDLNHRDGEGGKVVDDDDDDDHGGSECEMKFVTEMSPKKPERVFPKCPRGGRGQVPLAPIFAKRRQRQTEGDSRPTTKYQKMDSANARSKWSEYLELEDSEVNLGNEGNLAGDACGLFTSGRKSDFGDVFVEEEVHPDFK